MARPPPQLPALLPGLQRDVRGLRRAGRGAGHGAPGHRQCRCGECALCSYTATAVPRCTANIANACSHCYCTCQAIIKHASIAQIGSDRSTRDSAARCCRCCRRRPDHKPGRPAARLAGGLPHVVGLPARHRQRHCPDLRVGQRRRWGSGGQRCAAQARQLGPPLHGSAEAGGGIAQRRCMVACIVPHAVPVVASPELGVALEQRSGLERALAAFKRAWTGADTFYVCLFSICVPAWRCSRPGGVRYWITGWRRDVLSIVCHRGVCLRNCRVTPLFFYLFCVLLGNVPSR